MMDVFKQLQLTWIVPILFAAPFWVGMFWRRATTWGAWATVLFCLGFFFVVPAVLPKIHGDLRAHPEFLKTTPLVHTRTTRAAAPTDVSKRAMQRLAWEKAKQAGGAHLGDPPPLIQVGDTVEDLSITGGTPLFWSQPLTAWQDDQRVPVRPLGPPERINETTTVQRWGYPEGADVYGNGWFRLDLLLFHWGRASI